MPSAPNADEIATRLPKVSNAHSRVWPGPQVSAGDCTSLIFSLTKFSLTKWTPRRRQDFWSRRKYLLREIHCWMPDPPWRISPAEQRDRQDARPRPLSAASATPAAELAADAKWLCDEPAGAR